jgi:cardiolipin synthase
MISKGCRGNIKFQVEGRQSFKKIISRIRGAKKSIYINVFIWRDDKIGNIIGSELLDAANRGVKIEISKDRLGSVFEKAEENKQSFFHKSFNFALWSRQFFVGLLYGVRGNINSSRQRPNRVADLLMNHKNVKFSARIKGDHSKYYIFDDKYLIMGSMNIGNRMVYTDVRGQKWSDYMVDVDGEVFVENLRSRLMGDKRENGWCEFVLNSKEGGWNFEVKSAMLDLFDSAKKSVCVQMPYFGDRDITKKIIEIVNKGIGVVVILPKVPNFQKDYNYKIMRDLFVKTGGDVNIYLYNDMLHAKMLSVDGEKVLFGSANMNKGAMRKLSELNMLVSDRVFIRDVENSIKKHMKNSERVETLDQIKFNRIKALGESFFC